MEGAAPGECVHCTPVCPGVLCLLSDGHLPVGGGASAVVRPYLQLQLGLAGPLWLPERPVQQADRLCLRKLCPRQSPGLLALGGGGAATSRCRHQPETHGEVPSAWRGPLNETGLGHPEPKARSRSPGA